MSYRVYEEVREYPEVNAEVEEEEPHEESDYYESHLSLSVY